MSEALWRDSVRSSLQEAEHNLHRIAAGGASAPTMQHQHQQQHFDAQPQPQPQPHHHHVLYPAPSNSQSTKRFHSSMTNSNNNGESMEIQGLKMQLEMEKLARQDAMRELRESNECQFSELRETIKRMQVENNALRICLDDTLAGVEKQQRRQSSGSGGLSMRTNINSAAPASVFSQPQHHQQHVPLAKLTTLETRVGDVEASCDRMQRLLDDRHTRLETAVSDFTRAHLSAESERLKSLARDAATNGVEATVKRHSEMVRQALVAYVDEALREVRDRHSAAANVADDLAHFRRDTNSSLEDATRAVQRLADAQQRAEATATQARVDADSATAWRESTDRTLAALQRRTRRSRIARPAHSRT